MGLLRGIGRGLRGVVAFPFLLVPWREIGASGRAIGDGAQDLWAQTHRTGGAQQVITAADRLIDLRSFAEARGLTDGQTEALVRRRRRETARASYLCFALAWASFVGLLYRALAAPSTSGAFPAALEFSPFCLMFFLMAFQYALQNFRLRTLRHATAVEFLQTNEPFWPR